MKTLKIDFRKIIIGLLFGSLILIVPGLLDILFFEILKVSENNFPFPQIIYNLLTMNMIIGFFAGLFGLFLFSFKSKLKSFLTGFILAFITRSAAPLLLYFILAENSLVVPINTYLIFWIVPFVIGPILTNFFLPKEDFIPQKKNIIIIAVICLSLYVLSDTYYRIKTKVVTVPTDTVIEVSEPREAFLNEEKNSINRLPER